MTMQAEETAWGYWHLRAGRQPIASENYDRKSLRLWQADLSREQVAAVVEHLKQWLATGSLEVQK